MSRRAVAHRAMLVLTLLAIITTVASQRMEAKKYTITQRMQALHAKIDKGEKSGELTKKEADKLRDKMTGISEKIEKKKSKNGGKLSYKDEGSVEKDLNGVSVSIQKLELEKRVQAK